MRDRQSLPDPGQMKGEPILIQDGFDLAQLPYVSTDGNTRLLVYRVPSPFTLIPGHEAGPPLTVIGTLFVGGSWQLRTVRVGAYPHSYYGDIYLSTEISHHEEVSDPSVLLKAEAVPFLVKALEEAYAYRALRPAALVERDA